MLLCIFAGRNNGLDGSIIVELLKLRLKPGSFIYLSNGQ